MKSTLYRLNDISDITGKPNNKILEAVRYLGITPLTRVYAKNNGTKDYYSENDLKLIKYFFNDYHSKSPIEVPTNILKAIPDEENNNIKMCQSDSNGSIYYIFRGSGEEVEISIIQETTYSTHYLTLSECSYIRECVPQIPFQSYKIQKKIFQ